jgi:serine O-acetyltransferase
MSRAEHDKLRRAVMRDIRSRFPGFRTAVVADAAMNARYRGEREHFTSRLDTLLQIIRLCWQSDAFLGTVFYRTKASLQRRGVPVIPRIFHHLAMMNAQISIGDPVIVHPGVYIAHGQVVIDGLVEIHSGAVIAPWVSIGLRAGIVEGPVIEREANIGTGAKLLGPLRVGEGAKIGANAVVVSDVPAGVTAVGAPARAIST